MSLLEHQLAKCGQSITIQTRNTRPVSGKMTEVFADLAGMPVKAIIKTMSGKTIFDDTNTERAVTHKITLAYIAGITSENWIKLGTRRIKVLTVENCAEADKALILMCTERGEDVKAANES